MTQSHPAPPEESDPDLDRVVGEEDRCLERVLGHLVELRERPRRQDIDYDTQLLDLRDEIAAARMEDVPPLLEQMERLQMLAARQREVTTGYIDGRSPYFGRLVLKEGDRVREVLIGRSTYLDSRAGIRIVDWRDAPVSRLYYRYNEGDDYEETFGERDVEGEVLTRRSVAIVDGALRRIVAPQGMFIRDRSGQWKRGGGGTRLAGGQGTASRAEQHHRLGKLGLGDSDAIQEDKHLKEITALIDPRQFELISAPTSGLVVIQGGAGSGKTTIGLHRLAYLAYQDRRRFRPDRMLVVVFNDALARYIAQVLPALEVTGVAVRTYEAWAAKLRAAHVPRLTTRYSDDTPAVVTRLKKHPAMLRIIDAYVEAWTARISDKFAKAIDRNDPPEWRQKTLARFSRSTGPLAHRLHAMKRWATGSETESFSRFARHAIERIASSELRDCRDAVTAWSELLTDRAAIETGVQSHAAGAFTTRDIDQFIHWCSARCSLALTDLEEQAHANAEPKKKRRDAAQAEDRERLRGIDGAEIEDSAALDREDDALLLRLIQLLRGPLLRTSGKDALIYEHVLIDEAQDLSPVELAVVMGTVSKGQSVTLAGDVAQRLHMNNGFSNWDEVLGELGLSHVEIEPLRLSYRSTAQILDFAQHVLGPLAPETPPEATRSGAPVELMRFSHSGDAVGFLGEALRELIQQEPRASVAVVARYPEQADMYYDGLRQAETPYLRRIAEQDFPFKPGIDVTDIRQVKGLEFDYVVLVEVNESTYPVTEEARHLLHIGATRAAHQLWLLSSDRPSLLVPDQLRERGY